jgi:hypothetical protein
VTNANLGESEIKEIEITEYQWVDVRVSGEQEGNAEGEELRGTCILLLRLNLSPPTGGGANRGNLVFREKTGNSLDFCSKYDIMPGLLG